MCEHVRVFVCVTTIHDKTLKTGLVLSECGLAKASKLSLPHHYSLPSFWMYSAWCHWIWMVPIYVHILPAHTKPVARGSLHLWSSRRWQQSHTDKMHRPACVCRLKAYLSVQSVSFVLRCPTRKKPSSQGQMLNYHTMPSMAGDLQIISIDHGSNHTECRADSKIIST